MITAVCTQSTSNTVLFLYFITFMCGKLNHKMSPIRHITVDFCVNKMMFL